MLILFKDWKKQKPKTKKHKLNQPKKPKQQNTHPKKPQQHNGKLTVVFPQRTVEGAVCERRARCISLIAWKRVKRRKKNFL